MVTGTIHKRTFEAKKFPIGSQERAKLNEDVLTSEYYTSKKYAVLIDYPETDTHTAHRMKYTCSTKGVAKSFLNARLNEK